MLQRILKALCVFALLTPALTAQSYEIILKRNPAKGEVQEIKVTESQVGFTKILDANGTVVKEEKPNNTKVLEFTMTVLEGGDKRPAKYKETYTKAVFDNGRTQTNQPYHGRTILYELKDGKYEVKAEGEPALTEKDLADLIKQVNDKDDKLIDQIVPAKAVAVGDSWNVDTKKIAQAMAKSLNGEIDTDKTKVTGKLIKAYQKDKQQWGTLEVAMTFPIKSAGPLKLDPPGEFTTKTTLDVAIDGSSPAGTMKTTGVMIMQATLEQMGMKFTVDSKMDISNEKTVK